MAIYRVRDLVRINGAQPSVGRPYTVQPCGGEGGRRRWDALLDQLLAPTSPRQVLP